MRISSEIAKAINDQIAYEASATHAYAAIGSWCERTGYEGSATFFFEQATEENTHMLKFVHYLNTAGAEASNSTGQEIQLNFHPYPDGPVKYFGSYTRIEDRMSREMRKGK